LITLVAGHVEDMGFDLQNYVDVVFPLAKQGNGKPGITLFGERDDNCVGRAWAMGLPRQQILLTDLAAIPGGFRGSAVQGRCPVEAPAGAFPLEKVWLQKSMSLE
jgi:hypothetical protein